VSSVRITETVIEDESETRKKATPVLLPSHWEWLSNRRAQQVSWKHGDRPVLLSYLSSRRGEGLSAAGEGESMRASRSSMAKTTRAQKGNLSDVMRRRTRYKTLRA